LDGQRGEAGQQGQQCGAGARHKWVSVAGRTIDLVGVREMRKKRGRDKREDKKTVKGEVNRGRKKKRTKIREKK
jgi:hypothetical protein